MPVVDRHRLHAKQAQSFDLPNRVQLLQGWFYLDEISRKRNGLEAEMLCPFNVLIKEPLDVIR